MSMMSWLLDSDPAIRWQVLRDVLHESDDVVTAERARVAKEGWGAQLLARQTPAGPWGDGEDEGWMTTIQFLDLLKDFGIDPASAEARRAVGLVRDRLTWWQLDGRPFFEGETEPCINGRIVGIGAYFGEATDRLVERLLSEQLEDGGWNCEAPPSACSSFHSTICVLEGLLEYERAKGGRAGAVRKARLRGQEYLLERRMLRSRRTGEIIDRKWTRFSFPTRWHYDVLRGLDYMRKAGIEPDERVAEAISIVEQRRHQNKRWPMNLLHSDRIPFDMETGVGRASRWITLRALRVLEWGGKRG
ncbi:MAG: hypothetical protein ACE15D_10530 [Candidatus Eisenbacteria bacterium]